MNAEKSPVLLYDGTCGLCHGAVRFLLRHERECTLRFAAQQSEYGQKHLARLGFNSAPESLVLVDQDRALIEAEAAFALCAYLRAPWRWLRVFRFLPPALPRAVYRWIARNRKRHFGTRDACDLPSPEQSARFLG